MKIKESDYIGSKDVVIKALKRQGVEDINMISCTSGVPLLFVCIWYTEEIDPDDWLVIEKTATIMDFYGYTKIERV